MRHYSRRQFLGVAAAGSGAVLSACSLDAAGPKIWTHEDALMTARPTPPTTVAVTGYQALGISTVRDGMLYVPTTYQAATPAPLLVLLHGFSSSAQFWEDFGIGELIDDLGVVILAPDSRFAAWDILQNGIRGYGPDPKFINYAMLYVFQRCNIDPARIAIAGFGDGAFEAMGLGLANGDLFSRVMGYSPTGLLAPFIQGKPKMFVSQGTADGPALDFTQQYVIDRLQVNTYDVTFQTFEGGFELPQAIARQSVEWMLT